MNKAVVKDLKSILYQHANEKHNGLLPNINVEILSICPQDAMLRQVTESVCILDNKPTVPLTRKANGDIQIYRKNVNPKRNNNYNNAPPAPDGNNNTGLHDILAIQ